MAAKKYKLTRNVRIKNKLHKVGDHVELSKELLAELEALDAIDVEEQTETKQDKE